MKNKTKLIIISIITLIVFVGGYSFIQSQKGNDDLKNITITINDEGTQIYSETVKTKAKMLGELLSEMHEEKKIKIKYEKFELVNLIIGLGVEKLIEANESEGKYWLYDSKNNKECLAATYCDGVDILVIEDIDKFEFSYGS